MKKIIFVFLLLTIATKIFAQQLVSYEELATYTVAQIDSIYLANGIPGFALPSTYDVKVYKVDYNTLDADSLPILASGAFFVPINPACHVPLASYQHGTILNKQEVPSTLQAGEVIVGYAMASDGYAVCMPDYLGLGDSPGLHPYVHAETEAHAVADMLVASLDICDAIGITRNNQLFLVGYSQGGHATMAAHQLIQEHYGNYFTVTASSPMSGPYDLSGVQADIISSGAIYPNPGYLPYLLLAYNSIYHLYDSTSDYLVAPYDTLLPPLFDGTHSMDEVNSVMPDIPSEIIVPAVLDSFNNDPNYKLRSVLKENDTYFWIPNSPMRMYYCEGDQDVNYMNAIVAYDTFTAYGASGISLQSSGASYDHVACALPSLLNVKFWFDSLRLDKLKITFDVVSESHPGAADGSITAHVTSGYPPYTYQWS
jgi:pimeloyl-ACP methyl ester carboxylesterase